MLRFALPLLIMAMISGVLALLNAAIVPADIAWRIFVLFSVLSAISFVVDRPRRKRRPYNLASRAP